MLTIGSQSIKIYVFCHFKAIHLVKKRTLAKKKNVLCQKEQVYQLFEFVFGQFSIFLSHHICLAIFVELNNYFNFLKGILITSIFFGVIALHI